ncbi:MAG: DinB family protein [Pseudomonadota bacterium]
MAAEIAAEMAAAVTDPGYFLQQARNNAWANATLYAALAPLDPAAFAAPRPGFFPSLRETLNHIYEVDLYYIDALREGGQGRGVYVRRPIEESAVLAAAQAASDAALCSFCAGLTPPSLQAVRLTERREGMVAERVDWLLLHLFQHQIHHRGQAHVQLQHAGLAPPQLDDFYLTYGRVASAAGYWTDGNGGVA